MPFATFEQTKREGLLYGRKPFPVEKRREEHGVRRRREATQMMGSKRRHFASLIQASLEELVPPDHFYRHLERTLDLSFVCEFVQEAVRPSFTDELCGNIFNTL